MARIRRRQAHRLGRALNWDPARGQDPPSRGQSPPAYKINHIYDPSLQRVLGTILSPNGWQCQSRVQWDQANRMFQPCLMQVRVQGPDGQFVQYLPSWTPNPMSPAEMQSCMVTSEDQIVDRIARVAGLQDYHKRYVERVGHLQLVPGLPAEEGAISIYAFVVTGSHQGQSVHVLAKITASSPPGAPFVVVNEILPIVLGSGSKAFQQEQPQLYAVASSLRIDTQWLLTYMKIVYPTGQFTSDVIARNQAIYDECNVAWDKTIRGVSTYTIDGRDYDLPYTKVYSYDDTYIYAAPNAGLLPSGTTAVSPNRL